MNRLIEEKRLCVFVGEGGVGKTSCAAATAVTAALRGRRTAVLTIDPAPRLGDALGLPEIDDSPREVRSGPLASAPGSVVALRLDPKRTFDRLVRRYATDAETAKRLLANPIYRTVSTRSAEPTPTWPSNGCTNWSTTRPTTSSCSTPRPRSMQPTYCKRRGRLQRLMETDAAKMLADPAALLLRAGSKVAAATVTFLLAALERAFGSDLRRDVAEFAEGIDAVLRALTDRTGAVESLLAAPTTAVIQVLRPDAAKCGDR